MAKKIGEGQSLPPLCSKLVNSLSFEWEKNDLQKLVGMEPKLSHFTLHSFLRRHVLKTLPNVFIHSLNLVIF